MIEGMAMPMDYGKDKMKKKLMDAMGKPAVKKAVKKAAVKKVAMKVKKK